MSVELKCSSGLHTVRLRDDRFWQRALCPKCKTQVDRLRLRRLIRYLLRRTRRRAPQPIPDEIRYANLRWRIEKLAKASWQTRESLNNPTFLLETSSLEGLGRQEIVRVLLTHIRQIAPGLPVPQRVPDITTTIPDEAAGTFGATEGWAVISLAGDLPNLESVRAVLAHEICHYVLNAAGLREDDTDNNEKLTDLCMFVLGLGHIFLAGFKTQAVPEEYRPGHRLGYLSDAEYAFASRYVMAARRDNTLNLPSRAELLRSKILTRVGGDKTLDRLVADARRKSPNSSENEIYQSVYDALAR